MRSTALADAHDLDAALRPLDPGRIAQVSRTAELEHAGRTVGGGKGDQALGLDTTVVIIQIFRRLQVPQPPENHDTRSYA